MDERIRIILIIIVLVSIFGLLVFVYVKNYIKKRLEYFLNKKNKKKIIKNSQSVNNHLFQYPLLF